MSESVPFQTRTDTDYISVGDLQPTIIFGAYTRVDPYVTFLAPLQ